MKILVLPMLELNIDGNIEIHSINDWLGKNQESINKRLLGYLESELLFKDHNVYRLRDTDFYVIYTLPHELVEDIIDIYFRKLEDPFKSIITRNKIGIPTIIKFQTLYEYNEDEITDSELADEDYRNSMKHYFLQLNDLILDNVFLRFTNYSGANFSDTSLLNAECYNAQFMVANFNNSKLRGANLEYADMRYASLKNADLRVLSIAEQPSIKTILINANLKHADLSGADFTGADLSGADLRMAKLDNKTNFTGCNLMGTKFAGTNWEITIHDNPMVGAIFEMFERSPEEEASMRDQLALAEAEADEYEEAAEDDKDTCFYAYGYYDINIQKYLEKHPDNFVVEYGGKVTCESLTNLKKMFYGEYEIYYECSAKNIATTAKNGFTPISFSPEDYYTDKAYVKISPTTNFFVEKQDWMYEGPVPEPRHFRLVNTGVKKRLIEKSLTISGTNVVSGIHCDPLDTFEIYRLELISTGGRRKIYKKNLKTKTKTKQNKTKHNKQTKQTKNIRKKTRRNKK